MVPFSKYNKLLKEPEALEWLEDTRSFTIRNNKIISHFEYSLSQPSIDQKIKPIQEIIIGNKNDQDPGELHSFIKKHQFDVDNIQISKSSQNF